MGRLSQELQVNLAISLDQKVCLRQALIADRDRILAEIAEVSDDISREMALADQKVAAGREIPRHPGREPGAPHARQAPAGGAGRSAGDHHAGDDTRATQRQPASAYRVGGINAW